MASNQRDSQLIELKDTINNLNKLIESLQRTLDANNKLLSDMTIERDNYKEQVEYLKRKLFGSSSEKRDHDIEGQLSLFDELENEADHELAAKEAKQLAESLAESTTHKKSRSKNTDRFKGLPIHEVILEPESKVCPECGGELELIGKDYVRSELEFIPGRFRIIRYYSANYRCTNCVTERATPTIIRGKDGRAHMLHGMASASTVAWIIYQKFVNSMPLYRQEQDWKRYGVNVTRATLAFWVIKNADTFLTPLYEYLHKKLLQREILMADETPTQVLKEDGKRPESKSYMWLFRTGEDNEEPIILYKYSPTRAGETAYNFLEGFNGYLMCDGYSGYNKVPSAKRLACWAHVRRYILDAIPKAKQYDYTHPAVQGAIYCDKLFDLEKKIKARYKTEEEIKEARLKYEEPLLTGFWSWFDNLSATRNSKLDKAITYISNRREYLNVYLEDGRLSFSNNLSENSIRPFTVGRKNWLFNDTPAGANASAVIYSIIETAKANDVNVYQYLIYLLEELPKEELTDDRLETLCPWNEAIKAELTSRMDNANAE